MKFLGDADRLLAGGGIADEQDLLGSEQFLESDQFFNKGIINFPAPGSVIDLDIPTLTLAPALGSPGRGKNILLRGIGSENGNLDLLTQCRQLVDGGGTHKVKGNDCLLYTSPSPRD